MSEISQTDLNVWKAKAISRGKLLERFRDTVLNMVDGVENEGDRVYLGSTNDFDQLREIGKEMDMWKWDRILKERPERDPYADCRELRAALAAKDAELAALKDELVKANRDMDTYRDHGDRKSEQVIALQQSDRRLRMALTRCEIIGERIRANLINHLDEPVRRSFWDGVEIRDIAQDALTQPDAKSGEE